MQKKTVSDKIFLIENFWDLETCEQYIQLSEDIGFETASIDGIIDPERVKSVRNNYRAIYESSELAEELWQKVKPFIPTRVGNRKAIGLNERFRFYKYEPGHYFKPHLDGNYIRNEQEVSQLTFMIYLNGNYKGGITQFREHAIQGSTGNALIFYHKQMHESTLLEKEIKYVLRSDVMYCLEN